MTNIAPKELLNLVFEIGLLKRVIRTGWQNKGVNDPESVAEHTWRVAVLGMMLAPQYNLDQNKVMKMAMVHDLGEAAIGDVIWEQGKKIVGSQEEKHRDEQQAVEDMFKDNPHFAEYVELWKEFEAQETAEAKFVKQLDKLEMVIQAYEYEQEGQNPETLNEFWENAEKYIKDNHLEVYFDELKDLR